MKQGKLSATLSPSGSGVARLVRCGEVALGAEEKEVNSIRNCGAEEKDVLQRERSRPFLRER